MRTPYVIAGTALILAFVGGCSKSPSKVSHQTTILHRQATPANIQSMPFTVASDTYTNIRGAETFTVTANQEDGAQNSLQVGALWIYAGSNFISDCPVFHGPVVNGKVNFNFQVRTNYLDSSWFVLHYGTIKSWSASYSFYLKDFNLAK